MADRQLAVVILAAGQGTRMRSRTPKVLHEMAGAPLIAYVLDAAAGLDAAATLVVVRHERDAIAEVVKDHSPDARLVDQDDVPGTGRAVEVALDALPGDFDGDVVILSADVPLMNADTIRWMLDAHRQAGRALTLLSAIFDDPTGAGRIVRDATGHMVGIVEHRDANAAELEIREINAGVYVSDAARLRAALASLTTNNAQGEKYLTDAAAVIRERGGAIDALPVTDTWLVQGINDRAQLAETAAEWNRRLVRKWQLAGVTIMSPETVWIDRDVTIGQDTEILPSTSLKGATTIGANCVIGPDSTIVDCEVGDGAVVKRTDATLAEIGAGAQVGPWAYLRPGSQLAASSKVGTFCETKNATIGEGTKVPHLSYIGDTEIGEGSNIGAGSITANYDGVNKHRTKIGSYVRTSSHNVFVAPVEVGDGAYTGAGTVVRKNVPAGALGINVAPQRNLEGWVEEKRAGTASAEAAERAQSDRADRKAE